jgi:hypothetical protein
MTRYCRNRSKARLEQGKDMVGTESGQMAEKGKGKGRVAMAERQWQRRYRVGTE